MNLEDRIVEVVCIISEMLEESENNDEEPKEDTEKAKDGVAEPEEDIDRPKDSPLKPQGSAGQKDGMDEKRSHLSGNASFPCTRVKKGQSNLEQRLSNINIKNGVILLRSSCTFQGVLA